MSAVLPHLEITPQRPRWLAGVPGFEPGNDGIKIQVVRIIYQRAFRKSAEIGPQSVQEVSGYLGNDETHVERLSCAGLLCLNGSNEVTVWLRLRASSGMFSTAIWSALACMGMPLLALGPTVRPLGVRRFARLRRRPQTRRRVPPAPQCGLLAAFFRKVGAARPRSLPLSLPEGRGHLRVYFGQTCVASATVTADRLR